MPSPQHRSVEGRRVDDRRRIEQTDIGKEAGLDLAALGEPEALGE